MAPYNNYKDHVYYLYKKISVIFARTMMGRVLQSEGTMGKEGSEREGVRELGREGGREPV